MLGLKFRGRPAINFAKSVKDVVGMKNEYAQIIMDRNQAIDVELVSSIIAQGIMSYAGRTPAPALDPDGNFQCTDLDLLSFLVPLADRKAVIEIPKYRNCRQVIRRVGERKIGTNKFGPVTSLVSNQDLFSFSVKINDKSIITKDEFEKESVGEFRNYMVVGVDGQWYDGWDRIVWDPTADENAFLTKNKLWTGNTVQFQYFIHPNRWQSVFSAPHLLKKMLLTRIDDEADFYRSEMKRLTDLGIQLPDNEMKEARPVKAVGATEKIKVETMEMILTLPNFSGAYAPVSDTEEGMIEAYRRQKLLTYKWKPAVQFVVRANEAAYFLFGFDENGEAKVASWMKKRSWKPFQKNKRSALYNQMVLSNKMSLLYRLKVKTEHVSVI